MRFRYTQIAPCAAENTVEGVFNKPETHYAKRTVTVFRRASSDVGRLWSEYEGIHLTRGRELASHAIIFKESSSSPSLFTHSALQSLDLSCRIVKYSKLMLGITAILPCPQSYTPW